MPYLVLGICLLAALLLLGQWFANTNPRMLAFALRVAGIVVLLIFVGVIVLTERFYWVIYALPFALPFYFHWRSGKIRARNAQGPSAGQRSQVDTGWLRVELDHDSGDMRGTVERGRFAGRGLAGMDLDELMELREELSADPDSVRVLDAYLDRLHGAEWRGGEEGAQAGGARRRAAPGGAMTVEEAYEVLGLDPGASDDDIKEAHRKLMAKLHPDRGGSTYLAAKLNQAKDLLLKRR